MKNLLWILALVALSSWAPHKFYVSNNIVEYNPRTQLYEVTCKIFTDDLERALAPDGTSLFLGSEKEKNDVNWLIQEYIEKKFKIKINDKPIQFKYVGKEVDPELTHLYFEFAYVDMPNTVTVENTVLFEHFEDQKNIIDLRLNGWNYTMFLTKQKPSEVSYR
ncbi:MAG: DUF6702 family protein [Flavobacteriales bacterium]|jgi:hypothetical protein